MPPSPRTTMNKQNSHPRAEQEETQMDNQRHNKETCTGFFSSHVGRAVNVHEQAGNDNPSIQEHKEAAGHQ